VRLRVLALVALLVSGVTVVDGQIRARVSRGPRTPDVAPACQTVIFHTSFSTTDDPDWNQDYAQRPSPTNGNACPGPTWNGKQTGIAQSLDNITRNGNCDLIDAASNFSGGLGGRGFKHWRGDGTPPPGTQANDVGGGFVVQWGTATTDFWLRYYFKHELGFAYTGGAPEDIKDIFLQATGNWFGFDGVGLRLVSNGANYYANSPANWGFDDLVGGTTGDGVWHYADLHFVSDTNGTDGVFEAWIDGTRHIYYTNVNHEKNGGTFSEVIIGSNGKYPNNGADKAEFYDEIAVSLTGRIGAYSAACGN
jgi:hypothetical protein